jgi:hypothetical protein
MTVKQYTGRANINIYHGDCMEFMRNKTTKYNFPFLEITKSLANHLEVCIKIVDLRAIF